MFITIKIGNSIILYLFYSSLTDTLPQLLASSFSIPKSNLAKQRQSFYWTPSINSTISASILIWSPFAPLYLFCYRTISLIVCVFLEFHGQSSTFAQFNSSLYWQFSPVPKWPNLWKRESPFRRRATALTAQCYWYTKPWSASIAWWWPADYPSSESIRYSPISTF